MRSFHARSRKDELHYEGIKPDRPPAAPRDRHGLVRTDALLVACGLAPSRTAAQRMVAAGRVSGPAGRIDKPSHELPADAVLHVTEDADDRFVSRGGIKLAGALAHTNLDVRGRICLDVGQSTGGFTDCLIQAGAARVVGVDVGRTQLHPRLRGDARIACFEGLNCRTLVQDDLGDRAPDGGFDLIVADVSFISLTLILPQLPPLLTRLGDLLLLVKPQFEVGPEHIGKGGIVTDPMLYPMVRDKLTACCTEHHLVIIDWFDSPITGTDGNHEFFLHARHGQ
ncbi:TlyA family RNA methyltransferase [Rhodocyclaceae bacterium]